MIGANKYVYTLNNTNSAEWFARFGYDGNTVSENNLSKIDIPSAVNLQEKDFSLEVKYRILLLTYSHSENYQDHTFLGRNVSATSSVRYGLHLTIRQQNKLWFGFYGDDTGFDLGLNLLNTWHTCVFTFNHTTKEKKIYSDGSLVHTATAGGSYLSATPLTVGVWAVDKPNRQFVGDLAYLRLWDKTLNSTEVTNQDNSRILTPQTNLMVNYNFQNSQDDSGNNYDGTDTNIYYLTD